MSTNQVASSGFSGWTKVYLGLLLTGIGVQVAWSGWAGFLLVILAWNGLFSDSDSPKNLPGLVPEFPKDGKVRWTTVTTAEMERLEKKLSLVKEFQKTRSGGCWGWVKWAFGLSALTFVGSIFFTVGAWAIMSYEPMITEDETLGLMAIMIGDIGVLFLLYLGWAGSKTPATLVPEMLALKLPAFQKIEAMVLAETENTWEPSFQLALSTTPSGEVPVDLKLHFVPKNSPNGLLGIQAQISLNRGSPYAYFVIMTRDYLVIPRPTESGNDVYENKSEKGVNILVIRQFADKSGGYITSPEDILRLFRQVLATVGKMIENDP